MTAITQTELRRLFGLTPWPQTAVGQTIVEQTVVDVPSAAGAAVTPAIAEATPDPLAACLYVCQRLAGRQGDDAVAHGVQQATVAVAAAVARIVGSGELTFDLARSLPPLLRDLDVAIACRRSAYAGAVRLEAALDTALDSLTRSGSPAVLCALTQAQHDTVLIQRFERFRAAGAERTRPEPGDLAAQAHHLLQRVDRAAQAQPADAVLETLRHLGCMTLTLAVHLNGTDTAPEVAQAMRAMMTQLDGMNGLEGMAMMQAISTLTTRLSRLVHAMDTVTGGVCGLKPVLLAISHDLRTLTASTHAALMAPARPVAP